MNRYRAQAAAAVAAVKIRGPLRYTWLGKSSVGLRTALHGALDAAEQRAFLLERLEEELYVSFYCRGRVEPSRWREAEPVSPDPRLLDALPVGAVRTRWPVIERFGEEAIALTPGRGLRVRLPADGVVAVPRARPGLSPGFLTLLGDAELPGHEPIVRVYWHVLAGGAPPLVHALVAALGAVPFRLKLLDHPQRYDRCDALVLYVPAASFAELRERLAALAGTFATRLRPAIPAFTLPLAAGVGLAEDPADGTSFGERRCALLAEGILAAHEAGGDPLEVVAARFARAGVDLDHPFREPALAGHHVL